MVAVGTGVARIGSEMGAQEIGFYVSWERERERERDHQRFEISKLAATAAANEYVTRVGAFNRGSRQAHSNSAPKNMDLWFVDAPPAKEPSVACARRWSSIMLWP